MASLRTWLAAACVLAATWSAGVQPAAAQQALPKAEPVLSHIPAGSLGFVVIPNAKATAAKVDKFIADLGMAQMLARPDPQNPDNVIQASVLDLLRGMAQLGEGFNPNGGVAAVMLDPKAFDIDLVELMGLKGPPAMGEPGAGAGEKPKPKIPFVLFVPGTGVKEVFGAYQMEPAGKYTLINLRMGPTYAVKLGSYVLLSPNDKALDAVLTAGKKAAADLPEEQVKVLAEADLAYHVNMRVAGPIATQFLKQFEEQIVMQAGPMAPVVGMYMNFYRDMLAQLDLITVAARFVETGLVVEEMVSFRPDSAYGKAMAATKVTGRAPVDRLPDLPYVLAIGETGQTDEQTTKLMQDMVEALLKSEALAALPEEEKQRCRTIVQGLTGQIAGMQMVLGGAPAGKGLFGMSFVLQCNSAQKVKDLLAEKAKFVQGLIKHFGADEPDIQKLAIRYVKDVETVGGITADAIVIEHPNLDKMEEQERGEMKKVLGEDKIRFLVAAPDAKTVVVTFGGSRDFLVEALKAARGGGTIGTGEATAQAMKHLPADSSGLLLINGGNLFDLIVAGIKVMDPQTELPPFKITCKTPIAMGVGKAGRSTHVVAYVPTKLVQEVVGVFMSFRALRAGAGDKPVRGQDDL